MDTNQSNKPAVNSTNPIQYPLRSEIPIVTSLM